MRYGPSFTSICINQNSLFPIEGKHVRNEKLGGGIELKHGHYQSVRPCSSRDYSLAMIVDKKVSAFYPSMSVIDFLCDYFGIPINSDTQFKHHKLLDKMRLGDVRKQVSNLISGITVNTFHIRGEKRPYKKCSGLSSIPAKQINSGATPLVKYFYQTHEIILDYDNLPCLTFERTNGTTNLPLEVCWIAENQRYVGVLPPAQNREMIKRTAIPPKERLNEVYGLQKAIVEQSSTFMTEFGIQAESTPLRALGKLCATPSLLYGNQTVKPTAGQGSWNPGQLLSKPAQIAVWYMINLDSKYDDVSFRKFADGLYKKGKQLGLTIQQPPVCKSLKYEGESTVDMIFERTKQASIVVWIVGQDLESFLYGKIKSKVETGDTGENYAVSQFIRSETARKLNNVTFGNIMIKINVKLGGNNQLLDTQKVPLILRKDCKTMIIGADVTHHTPADRTESYVSGPCRLEYSIAALVGTTDDTFFNYYTATRVQLKEKLEMITQFGEMFEEVLRYYFENNQTLPEHIIYYRDGVSEGQFNSVRDEEYRQMRDLFSNSLELFGVENYEPKVVIVIVQKRHNNRFRPQFDKDGIGRHKNVPAGWLS